MEGIALDLRARHGGIQEIEVEERVVADQHRAGTFGGAHRGAHLAEYALQRILLGNRRAQWMMWIDAGDGERGRLEVRPGKRRDVITVRLAAGEVPSGASR